MRKFQSVLRVGGLLLSAAALVWFMLPVVLGRYLGLGTVFGVFVSLTGIFLLLFYKKNSECGGWKKAVMRLLAFCFAVGLIWSGYLTALMLSASSKRPPENTNIIVLGARIYDDGLLSQSLRQRVESAYAYLTEQPEAICIVTGGQGDDEPFAEALAQKKALVKMGIAEDRILMEDRSRSTRQNFLFAAEIAKEKGLGMEFAITTQDFHLYRSLKLAESAGLKAYALPSETDWRMLPAYYGRELLSLTKWKLEEWFKA